MNNCDTEIVSALKLSIAERIGSDRFGTWFRKTRIEHRDGTVRILAAHEFALNILRNKIRNEIEEACQLVIGESSKVEFLVDATCTASSSDKSDNQLTASNADSNREPTVAAVSYTHLTLPKTPYV